MESPIHQFDLDGLTVLLKESHDYPVVSLDALVNVGSKDEPIELAGVAHFIEHMLFRGRDGEGSSDPAARLQAVGGEMNGYTNQDYTCCTVTVASRYLDLALEIQSEIFSQPEFREEDIEMERNIILQEIRLFEDDPMAAAQAQGKCRLFGEHPYGRPVHGGMRSVSRIQHSEIVEFFEKNYCRERMILVGVGDFDADALVVKLRDRLGGIRSIVPTPSSFDEKPGNPEPGFLKIPQPLQVSYLEMVYPGVPMSHPDFAAMTALSIILGGGRVSRIFRDLYERQRLIFSCSSAIPPMKLAGLFGISVSFAPEREKVVRDAMKEQITRLREKEVEEDELQMVRTKIEASSIFKNENVVGQSYTLGMMASLASPDFESGFLESIRNLTAADLRRVANEYLAEGNLSELCVGPKMPQNLDVPALNGDAPALPSLKSAAMGDFELIDGGDVKKILLPNKVTLLIKEEHSHPIVNIGAFLKVGSVLDPLDKTGVASLTHDMLHRGTRTHSPEQIAYATESLGAEFSGASSVDYSRFDAYGLSKDFDALLQLFAEVVLEPRFDDDEFGIIQAEALTGLKAMVDEFEFQANRTISETVYGDHPYARNAFGTIETIQSLDASDLADFHQRYYRGENMVVVVAGDIGWENAAARVAGALQAMPADAEPLPEFPGFPEITETFDLKLKMPFATPSVSLGWRLPPTLHPDFPALQVLSVILGGPFSSRMWIEMREERGLAYSCGASLLQGVQAGGIMAYAATDKKQLQAAREIILSQVADLQDNACSKEELEIAQRYIIGTHELAHQGPSAWVEFLGASEVSGLGWEYDFEYPELIERVTPEDIQRVAATYLPIDRPVVLTVRPMGFIGLLWMALKRKILGR